MSMYTCKYVQLIEISIATMHDKAVLPDNKRLFGNSWGRGWLLKVFYFLSSKMYAKWDRKDATLLYEILKYAPIMNLPLTVSTCWQSPTG